MIKSFAPIVSEKSRVLVLGSMPGEESLRKNQYYAHARNYFWQFMFAALEVEFSENYEIRISVLKNASVALWDVLKECRRKGSLDSSIECSSELANDICGLLQRAPEIRKICFNGQKAFASFKKHVLKFNEDLEESYEFVVLPSTSPANAGISFERKFASWRDEVWCCPKTEI